MCRFQTKLRKSSVLLTKHPSLSCVIHLFHLLSTMFPNSFCSSASHLASTLPLSHFSVSCGYCLWYPLYYWFLCVLLLLSAAATLLLVCVCAALTVCGRNSIIGHSVFLACPFTPPFFHTFIISPLPSLLTFFFNLSSPLLSSPTSSPAWGWGCVGQPVGPQGRPQIQVIINRAAQLERERERAGHSAIVIFFSFFLHTFLPPMPFF